MKSSITEAQFVRWAAIKERGMWRFILGRWTITFGGLTATLLALYFGIRFPERTVLGVFKITIVVFPTIGLAFGCLAWPLMNAQYRSSQYRNSPHRPSQSD